MQNNILFTPSLSTGCVAGIMREYVLNQAKIKNIEVKIGTYKPDVLYDADVVFCSNVAGLRFLNIAQKNVHALETNKILNLFG